MSFKLKTSYKELEFATDNFSPANVVGDGGYGIVYRGVLRDGTVAAIKKLHRDGKHGERAFRVEALPRLTSRQKVVEMVDPALKGQFSKKDIIQIAAIAAVCVQAEPEYRPLITDVVQSMIPLVKHLSSVPSSSSRFPSNNMVSPKIQRHSF